MCGASYEQHQRLHHCWENKQLFFCPNWFFSVSRLKPRFCLAIMANSTTISIALRANKHCTTDKKSQKIFAWICKVVQVVWLWPTQSHLAMNEWNGTDQSRAIAIYVCMWFFDFPPIDLQNQLIRANICGKKSNTYNGFEYAEISFLIGHQGIVCIFCFSFEETRLEKYQTTKKFQI